MNTNAEVSKVLAALAKLRLPFEKHQISKLPKPTKKQTEEIKADFKKGIRCKLCGGWHHADVVHLDYVGHAALTDRLLDTDPEWNWSPLSLNTDGSPRIDNHGGLWIKLTVCGVTRLGYGHADGKSGGDAIKEVIGDALRNAAMRFGAALDLWHKGDLHKDAEEDQVKVDNKPVSLNNKKTEQSISAGKVVSTDMEAKDFINDTIIGHAPPYPEPPITDDLDEYLGVDMSDISHQIDVYTIPFGKHTGRGLRDLGLAACQSYVTWIKDKNSSEGRGEIVGTVKEFIEMVDLYAKEFQHDADKEYWSKNGKSDRSEVRENQNQPD